MALSIEKEKSLSSVSNETPEVRPDWMGLAPVPTTKQRMSSVVGRWDVLSDLV